MQDTVSEIIKDTTPLFTNDTIVFGVLLFISVVFLNYMYLDSGVRILFAIGVPLATVLYLIVLRLWAEFMANIYRIGENTQKMVDSR